MGEVWKARDTKLSRDVALKVLPESFAQDPERLERFDREARLLASLDHPHIARIHGLEEAEGVRALVLELVVGETLADWVARGGSRERNRQHVDQALSIARQVADALDAAHEKGIVHRDLKPANVMLTDARVVKVLDFGLAKATDPPSAAAHEAPTVADATRAGTVLGTPAYMSPEQVRGQKLDKRTDVWAFGCLLYELLAGRPAFSGASIPDVFAAVLERQPDLVALPPTTPDAVRRLLARCLEKDVNRRLRDIGDARNELGDLAASAARGSEHAAREATVSSGTSPQPATRDLVDTLAVLPFHTASPTPDAEYLSDGITETVINALGQLTGLKVMARSTVFRYQGEDPREVGRQLGVRVVLTGRLFQRGETLVIGAELVEVQSGAQVWGQQYRRQMTDIFDLQEEIARAISDQLRVKLTSEDHDRLGKRYTDDRYAYEAYLRGRYCWNQRSLAGMRASVDHFRAAIDRDPLYALAYAGLGDALAMIGIYHGAAPAESFPKAEVAARRALEIDADLAEAIATLGFVELYHDWDTEAAKATLREAIRRKPAYPSAHQWLSMCLALAGDFEAALAESKLALDLDPFSASINTSAAWPLLWGRRTDEAVDRLSAAVELHPSYWTAHYYLGLAHQQRGDSDRAIGALEKARSLSDSSWGADALAYAYAMAGRRADAEAVLQRLRDLASSEYVSPYSYAVIEAGLGDRDRAFESLHAAIDDRSWRMAYLDVDLFFDGLRSDPRFAELSSRRRARRA